MEFSEMFRGKQSLNKGGGRGGGRGGGGGGGGERGGRVSRGYELRTMKMLTSRFRDSKLSLKRRTHYVI